jgi:hypothetical protein
VSRSTRRPRAYTNCALDLWDKNVDVGCDPHLFAVRPFWNTKVCLRRSTISLYPLLAQLSADVVHGFSVIPLTVAADALLGLSARLGYGLKTSATGLRPTGNAPAARVKIDLAIPQQALAEATTT